ncbi:MAG: hypothetical protein IPO09_19530 [Anaeromyxobacter sp.]|nr:hypothetical protein [Anaeromyxobacter sp.]
MGTSHDGALVHQLERALCSAKDCQPWAKVSTRGVLDLKKAGPLQVKGVLTGSVARKGAGRQLSLSFFTGKALATRTWTFPLDASGLLAPAAVRQLQTELRALVGGQPPPVKAPELVTPARPAPVVVPAPAVRPPLAPAPAAEPVVAPAPVGGRPLVAAELGLRLASRTLAYQGARPAGARLLAFDVPLVSGPVLRAELYPLAHGDGVLLQGLGLFVGYARTFAVDTKAQDGAVVGDTTFTRLEAGVLWRTPPLGSWRLTLVPALSYQRHSATSSPLVPGLPDAELAGLGLAVGAEAPLPGRLMLLAGLGYVAWSTARDLVSGSPAFFPGGSASAVDLEAGLAVALGRRLSLRGLLEARLIRYSLEPDPSGAYVADGASDTNLGARVLLHGEY